MCLLLNGDAFDLASGGISWSCAGDENKSCGLHGLAIGCRRFCRLGCKHDLTKHGISFCGDSAVRRRRSSGSNAPFRSDSGNYSEAELVTVQAR
jgi:hypothetical protein